MQGSEKGNIITKINNDTGTGVLQLNQLLFYKPTYALY